MLDDIVFRAVTFCERRALAVVAVLILVATLAAFVPANRAARLAIVDALRHV